MRVLIAAHGHPRLSPGGGENAAYALHLQLQILDGVTSYFLASAEDRWLAYGGDLGSLASDEWLMRRSGCGFFYPSAVRLDEDSDLAEAVRGYSPDVIHLHHFVHLGLDLIHAFRRWCPSARIVFTLHEFLSLCPFNGQLLRLDGRLCAGPSSLDCQQCLPERSAADLLLRDQLIRSSLALVDAFISPSQYLIERWMQWAEASRAQLPVPFLIDNLLPPALLSGLGEARSHSLERCRQPGSCVFAYFGQLIPSKGIDLLLDAWQRLVRFQPGAHLVIHGRIPFCHGEMSIFVDNLQQRLAGMRDSVTLAGPYSQEQLPALMAEVDWVVMCSRWSENSPVVIQEARACGRPLLVPALGGMAEKVRDGIDGFHYTPQSALALSELMRRCCEEDHLWRQLVATQASPPDQDDLLRAHLAVYRDQNPSPVDSFPVRPNPPVECIERATTLQDKPRAWISWQRLANLAGASPSSLVHFRYVSLRSLPGGQWRIDLQLPVSEPGLWQFAMGWNGELLEERWLESRDGVVEWGSLCPNVSLENVEEEHLHWLDWQLLGFDGNELFSASRLLWVDPLFAPAGLDSSRWIQILNQLALLALRCGSRTPIALDVEPELLIALESIWPYLQGAPCLDSKAPWLACTTGGNWDIRWRSD